ncbi:DNA polymerase III subunit delta [Falsiporphyromonas endometrii]|uniref:DNA polymerase III subunit delta n=1 Tax=Falsiporphyromonas endometrii TaxID=1387297 RepID=A0ABV9K8Z8_9PORP|nr:DNA polymerase III subunit delta [Porphyromonadaceae bacterium]
MALNYDTIIQEIKNKKTRRFYLLAGDEPYYIDKLVNLFENNLVAEENRDFDQIVTYGSNDVKARDVISDSMRLPMIGQIMLIVIKEAQQISDLDKLAPYLESIPETSTLVIATKKKADKRKVLFKKAIELDALFESNRIQDYKLPDMIQMLVTGKSGIIDPQSASMLAEFLGNDLEKIDREIDKLMIILKQNGNLRLQITPELIEKHIGISKEYNGFEFLNAVTRRDREKAYRIAIQFGKNEKNYPIQPILAILFNFFSLLMCACYSPDKSEAGLMKALELRNRFQARDYANALRIYSPMKVYEIIRYLRIVDAMSKGVDTGSAISNKELLFQLLNKIFN